MIDGEAVNPNELNMGVRMIRDEAISRGWKVWLYYINNGQMRLQRRDGTILEIFNATPPTTAVAQAHLANNKYLASILLESNNFSIPKTELHDSKDGATAAARRLVKAGHKIVVKPLSAAHGHGVTVAISKASQVKPAIESSQEYSSQIIIQEYLENYVDLRLACIDFKFIAGLVRVPAHVIGDGKHTVRQLIERENNNPNRGTDYQKPLNKIDTDSAKQFLGKTIDSVPAKGRHVTVIGVANVGAGGETIDVTDQSPTWLVKMAEAVAKAFGLPVTGVDIMVKKVPEKNDKIDDLRPKVIEVNTCPALFLHEVPTRGKARPVIKTYVDYLDSL
jgi:cyanophycin synthetase